MEIAQRHLYVGSYIAQFGDPETRLPCVGAMLFGGVDIRNGPGMQPRAQQMLAVPEFLYSTPAGSRPSTDIIPTY